MASKPSNKPKAIDDVHAVIDQKGKLVALVHDAQSIKGLSGWKAVKGRFVPAGAVDPGMQLAGLQLSLYAHTADVKQVCDLLIKNQVKRAVKILGHTTERLETALRKVAIENGKPARPRRGAREGAPKGAK